jgi:flagellar basal-body rod protein FlgG
MHNTIWNAVAGSVFQMRQLDTAANNLANADTPGFKSDRVTFASYLAQIQKPAFAAERMSIQRVEERIRSHTSHAPGAITQTGGDLDFAINGPGYFEVQTPDGPQYTRAGNFRLDDQGQLVTSDGYIVGGEGGPIAFQEGQPMEIRIDEYGAIYQAGQEIGRLAVVDIENPATLTKVAGRRFAATRETRVAPMEAPEIVQGALETSNVNVVQEVMQVMQAGRAFEAYQRVIQVVNNLNQQANQQIAGQ